MRTGSGDAAGRPVLRGVRAAALVMAGALTMTGAAWGQIQAPRYQSPIEAPKPQLTMPAQDAITPNGAVVEYPIVRVNDQIIDISDYQRAQQQLLEEAHRANATPAEVTEEQKDLLSDMIDKQLLISRGKELDLNVDAAVVRAMDDIRKRNNLDSMEDLEKAVRESGESVEDWKAGIKNDLLQQEVIRNEVARNLHSPTTKQEQAFYDQHKQEFNVPDEYVRLSEILVPTADDATDAQVAQAKVKADDVVAKLKAGAKFEDLVKQYPDSPNPEQGGDLNTTYKRGDLGSPVLEAPVFALKAGEWTAPIRTRQGFVIFKVTQHIQAGIPPLSAVEPQIQDALFGEALKPAVRTYLTGLREKAYIDIAPGFVDAGASGKETKPVFAAATPLPVKKKQQQKARMDQAHPAAVVPAATGTTAMAAGAKPAVVTAAAPAADSAAAKTKTVSANKKPKKVRKEKIRFGQAPRSSLPATTSETLAPGSDQGTGVAAGGLPVQGAVNATLSQTTDVASDDLPLTPVAERKKSRYSDRAPIEDKAKRDAKAAKAKETAATVAAQSTDQQLQQKVQNAALGLGGDTATKKKKQKRAKGDAKERLQEQSPAPPKAKPDATPIPPKSVRENGEPVVNPPPAVPAPVDAQPSTSASPPAQ